jgi:hypothetical protein
MDLSTAVFITLFTVVFVVVFLLRLRYFMRYSRMKRKVGKETELFLANFDPSKFTDFDTFSFLVGSFSHISPFPVQIDREWRYTIYLTSSEIEDMDTITHEINECTLGRVIEKLLELKKPLYLHRKQDEKFWISGRQQKYILEHLLTALGEFGDIPKQKQEERIAHADIQKWQLDA